MKLTGLILAVIVCVSAHGQELNIEDFEPILLPAATQPRAGSHGSTWETELTVRNDMNEPVIFSQGEPICRLGTCPSPFIQIAPLTTAYWPHENVPESLFVGALLYVEREHSDALTLNLRLRETSRNQSRLGTNVPVIREGEFFTRKIQILNVPVDPLHRINLRLFEIDRESSPAVTIRIIGQDDEVIWRADRPLFVRDTRTFADYPAEDALYNVQDLVPATVCCDPIRIEIEPIRPGRYWAYATLVNNATQEVLLITPE